jgi:hypothetical protein
VAVNVTNGQISGYLQWLWGNVNARWNCARMGGSYAMMGNCGERRIEYFVMRVRMKESSVRIKNRAKT